MTSTAFRDRHIGPDASAVSHMLDVVAEASGLTLDSTDDLIAAAVPANIRLDQPLRLPHAQTEPGVLDRLRGLAGSITVRRAMIGLGYYPSHTPGVIQRNVLESPGWYTAYTPYQPEISQGRLAAMLNFQTMVSDLTGLDTANASLLDEGTAAAEAMALLRRQVKGKKDAAFFVDAQVLPQTRDVLRTRAEFVGQAIVEVDLSGGAEALRAALSEQDAYGLLLQYPCADGEVRDDEAVVAAAKEAGLMVAVAADLLAMTLLRPPGEIGADVAVGTSQRFGVPMGFGGPHAGYMAVRSGLERSLPGRLVGVSQDAAGRPAYRLALQTREQHIRRDRATSNICTAQVLLAVLASMYAVYHGPNGLRAIAARAHRHTNELAQLLRGAGLDVVHTDVFDTLLVRAPGRARELVDAAAQVGYLLRLVDHDHLGISCDETTTEVDVSAVAGALGAPGSADSDDAASAADLPADGDGAGQGLPELPDTIPAAVRRASDFLTHPVFNSHHSETQMLRYLRSLCDKDFALDRGMIPLGSCTMKLNATTEMAPISWPEFSALHPFAPAEDSAGFRELIGELQDWLVQITGYHAVSLQPNAGAQGELAGLMAIRACHQAAGDTQRTVCLIPGSAHGTNAASAVMAGLRVVVVKTDDFGNVDMTDLKAKVSEHADELAAIMVTYPSTHGVYEEGIVALCEVVHEAGGLVYVDGANMNALVGVAKPGWFGADVSHLNLHKTFCIPHGGGGPGVGPVGVVERLAEFLPGEGIGPVSSAHFGSASILPISWAYIALMGPDGLRAATHVAVLSANYIAARLRDHYPVLYTGPNALVAHECILDVRPLTKDTGVSVDDIAKRLIDYGFHAPTMSFPVSGTLMVEPTESESLAELDRFIDAMIAIKGEADRVAAGEWPLEQSPLRGAPHTAHCLTQKWTVPYSREDAAYPPGVQPDSKYWPPVRRVDGAYGDRHLQCSCPPMEDLAEDS